ncbi:unnamed protein product [Paramecium sonneborni]|uniref:Transmembrane protein n=1 Tax=Paramecium sonneborni TaxID=65129 RepID=A0A8S1QCR9_9CILI|nr:unnamed protein product [Paramecium sonneborni]
MLFTFILISKCFARINLTIGIDITNKTSLNYLGTLEKHNQQFQEIGLILNILYRILPCYSCQIRHNFTKPEPNCYGGGRYCQFSTYANGQLLLKEIIRQKCLFIKDVSLFLSYINYFQQDCLDNPDYAFCSKQILEQKLLNNDTIEINQCINDSFLGEGDQALLENFILAQEMKQQYNQSTLTVYLNNQDISNQKFDVLFENIYQKLKKNNFEIKTNQQIDEIQFYVFIALLILLILISIKVLKKSDDQVFPMEEKKWIIQLENVK